MQDNGSIYIEINKFKSINKLKLRLNPLTILIGPPASGKSALLEAIGLTGYALETWLGERLNYFWSNTTSRPITKYVRGNSCQDLLNKHSHAEKFFIKINNKIIEGSCEEPYRLKLKIMFYKKEMEALLDVKYASLKSSASKLQEIASMVGNNDELGALFAFLSALLKGIVGVAPEKLVQVVEETLIPGNYELYYPRLYGFDRLGAVRNIMEGNTKKRFPPFLEPDASNLGSILYTNHDLLEQLNIILKDITGITVEPLHDGRIAFKDGYLDVGPASISDSVLRLIYGITALLSSREENRSIIVKKTKDSKNEGKTEKIYVNIKHIIMLEEPEAHMYPVAYSELADIISESINMKNFVVVTTHSGRLAEILYEKVKYPISIYYMSRNIKSKYSKIYKVNLYKAADYLLDLDDLIHLNLNEIRKLINKGVLEPVRY